MALGMALRWRLERVGVALPEPEPLAPPPNLAALTAAQVAEVEALAARCTCGSEWEGVPWPVGPGRAVGYRAGAAGGLDA